MRRNAGGDSSPDDEYVLNDRKDENDNERIERVHLCPSVTCSIGLADLSSASRIDPPYAREWIDWIDRATARPAVLAARPFRDAPDGSNALGDSPIALSVDRACDTGCSARMAC